jgi:hypothetical protein
MSNEQVYAAGLLNRALDPATQPPEIHAFLQAEIGWRGRLSASQGDKAKSQREDVTAATSEMRGRSVAATRDRSLATARGSRAR